MIQVGDKFYEGDNLWTVEGVNDDVVSVRSENEYVQMPDRYVMELMYEQQKQRADELEDVIKRYHDEALREIKRADELENTLAYIKSHLNNLWYNGDASEHEYAANTLKYIESLQEDDNA